MLQYIIICKASLAIMSMQIPCIWCTHPHKQVSAIGVTPQDVSVVSVTLTETSTTAFVSWMAGRHIQTDIC